MSKQFAQADTVTKFRFNKQSFVAYYYQISEALALKPKTCLLIGQGDNITPSVLKGLVCEDMEVDTFDIVEDMNPTYIGDIVDINKIVKKTYDIVICCEVLEHLPFEKLSLCLENISKLQTKGVVLSLPVYAMSIYIKLWIPKIIDDAIRISIPYKPGRKAGGLGHYWEINNREGITCRKVMNAIENHFFIEKRFRPRDNPYHMFFILKNKCKPEDHAAQ